MNKPIAVLSTDWHIKDDLREDNCFEIISLVKQQIELAKKLGVNTLICLGDVFTSRKSQSLKALMTFRIILNTIKSEGMYLHCIPGNHDKTSYESNDSFLDPFQGENFFLHRSFGVHIIEQVTLYFMPFFEINTYLEKFANFTPKSDFKHVLLSHQALTGSKNNDGSIVTNRLTPSFFKDFDLVLLGHYHDYQEINQKIFHIPSIRQNNFGEDEIKGFVVLHDDLDFEIITSNFKRFKKYTIDLSNLSKKELKSAVLEAESLSKDNNVRIEFVGDETKLCQVDTNDFASKGIDIKKKLLISDSQDAIFDTKISYEDDDIIKAFEQFCIENDYDYQENVEFLKQ